LRVGARPGCLRSLLRINVALDLYDGGIDFAVNSDGDILFFEGNATMVMAPLSGDEKWDYRRPAFNAVFATVRAMLVERSSRASVMSA
jgi:hypothetical protein